MSPSNMWALLPLLVASAARAQSVGLDRYLGSVCMPTNSSGYPDMNVPCNAVAAIQAQCVYGPGVLDILFASFDSSASEDHPKRAARSGAKDADAKVGYDLPPPQSNETQRVCLCESQFWDQVSGCMACYKGHGGDMALGEYVPESALSSASSAYCAATATATIGLADYLFRLIDSVAPTSSPQPEGTPSVSFRDAIGNKTEVSYYFTAAVTGTEAWSVSQPTGSSGSASYTTTNVVDGQVRATASQNNPAATESANSSSSNDNDGETGNMAGRYEPVAAAGIFGLVALLALL